MDNLRLDDFIRNVLAAGVALLVLALAYPCEAVEFWRGPTSHAGEFGLVLLIFGSFVYGVHRAIIYPVVSRMIEARVIRSRRMPKQTEPWYKLKPTDLELELIRKWWNGEKPEGAGRWASQVHALYCSAWAIIVVGFTAPCFLGNPEHVGWFVIPPLVALAGAVWDDTRLKNAVIDVVLKGTGP